MGFNDTSDAHGSSTKKSWINSIFDCVIDVPTCRNSGASCDAINNTIISRGLANLASNTLGLAVLGESSGSTEVTETVDALQLLIAVGRGLQVLDECGFGRGTLAVGG
jgi:hypothetical protein